MSFVRRCSQENEFVQNLGKAYEEIGFVAVKNHGISDDLISDLYKYVQQFFSLPLEQKSNMKLKTWQGNGVIQVLVKSMQKEARLLI